ncbi:MAG: hypothetical protein IJV52_02960 [Prevotella sp.]|nr:hypothetical protein [Prevotella sp.]
MKKLVLFDFAVLVMAACTDKKEKLMQRANELCQYIPDHKLLEKSKNFLTADFYAVLDTMFNHLPEHEAMDHEWLYYFVTSNGGKMADYEVIDIEQTDATHAVATISVRQKWEDGSIDENSDIEEHKLYMEKVNGQWLMSDFDEHKQDCIRHIEINRKEQAVRDAMGEYLVNEIGKHYQQGEVCVPTLMIVATEESDSTKAQVWCDCWIDWYRVAGDTLKTVSGGNHSGCMTLQLKDGKPVVTAFEQTLDGNRNLPSAKRIFGKHYDAYEGMHSKQDVRDAARKEQLREYVLRHKLNIRYYQDYGWDAVEL